MKEGIHVSNLMLSCQVQGFLLFWLTIEIKENLKLKVQQYISPLFSPC